MELLTTMNLSVPLLLIPSYRAKNKPRPGNQSWRLLAPKYFRPV